MSNATSLTREQVSSAVRYDPKTGVFTWKTTIGRAKAGDTAGYLNPRGYIKISIGGNLYLAHRLAFLMMTGRWPIYGVDHINGIKNDNRWGNLRDVPDRINIQNKRWSKRGRKNYELPLGVQVCPDSFSNPYRARIQVNGKSVHLGLFPTADAAHLAYVEAKRMYHEGCTL
jgi:hypothetical protein